MHRSSESIAAIASALAKAQTALVNPEKTMTATAIDRCSRSSSSARTAPSTGTADDPWRSARRAAIACASCRRNASSRSAMSLRRIISSSSSRSPGRRSWSIAALSMRDRSIARSTRCSTLPAEARSSSMPPYRSTACAASAPSAGSSPARSAASTVASRRPHRAVTVTGRHVHRRALLGAADGAPPNSASNAASNRPRGSCSLTSAARRQSRTTRGHRCRCTAAPRGIDHLTGGHVDARSAQPLGEEHDAFDHRHGRRCPDRVTRCGPA